MDYSPLNYNKINTLAGAYSPSSVKSYNNLTFGYWERSLFQRSLSVFDFTVPQEWKGQIEDFFYYCLYRIGFVAVSQNDQYGYFFQPCTLMGMGFYYQPLEAIITNPLYKATLKIGSECELLKLTPDFLGIWDIIQYYAEKLSLLDNAVNLSLINNKLAFLIGAKTKNAAEFLKKAFDKINKGEPAVIYDQKLANDPMSKEEPFTIWERQDLKSNYVTTDQLMDFQTILNNFDSEIGIPVLPYQKKERMVKSEASGRLEDGKSRAMVWYRTLKSSIDKIKELYPDIRLDVELRKPEIKTGSEATEGGETNG